MAGRADGREARRFHPPIVVVNFTAPLVAKVSGEPMA